jgi:transposase
LSIFYLRSVSFSIDFHVMQLVTKAIDKVRRKQQKQMDEEVRLLWSKPNRKSGRRFLATWIMDAIEAADDYLMVTGTKVLEPLRKLARTLINHFIGILNFFDYPVTNGKIEGINNKIKTLKRQAYGYRDNEYFKLRLLHLHEQKTRLAG